MLCERVPAPTGNEVAGNIVPNTLVSAKEEMDIRLWILYPNEGSAAKTPDSLMLSQEAAKKDMQTLALEIVTAAQDKSNEAHILQNL